MIRIDNPGGEWLRNKQEKAAERHAPTERGLAAKALGGATTAWTKAIMIPTRALEGVGGVNNERRRPGEPQYDALAAVVAKRGWDPEQDGNAVLIAVNHFGEAYAIEGNTRMAYAAANGIEEIRAEIRWFNGAEEVEGPWKVVDGRVAILSLEDDSDLRP